LEGAVRPGHFDGVATVVAKLFGQVRPDIALFGEKDFQQLAMVRRLAADLDCGVDIVAVPTVRDADGLALSSRNAYLTPGERAIAAALPRTLAETATAIAGGADVAAALSTGRQRLIDAGFAPPDYVELVDEASLATLTTLTRPARLVAAARLGTTRLIDNLSV
jgi:pantoate--beta-alanine ligase